MHEEARARILTKLRLELGREICNALEDPEVIEILLNPDRSLWIERVGGKIDKIKEMHPSVAESVISTVASYVGTIVTKERPILECEFPLDSSRFEALLPPVVTSPAFSLRKKAVKVMTLNDYVVNGILDQEQMNMLVEAVRARKNVIVAGGTSSGKTTFTNALIDATVKETPEHRLVIIEDTREIQCQAENHVMLRTTEGVTMTSLLRATMRLRPDRILVGEVRGGEALALLKAWNTGHSGGVATLHANHAYAALIRLEQLIAEATETPMQRLIAEAVDIIVVIAKTPEGRRITEIAEVSDYDLNKGYKLNFWGKHEKN